MAGKCKQYGFSLTETLFAVATLAIGLLFVAGTFIVGMQFSTLSTERTIAVVTAEQAFATIELYGLDPNDSRLNTTSMVAYDSLVPLLGGQMTFPATENPSDTKYYNWSAFCRRTSLNPELIQVTVFVCRRQGLNNLYRIRETGPGWPGLTTDSYPRPLLVKVTGAMLSNELTIIDSVLTDAIDERDFINDGYYIVDDQTGQIYRVTERTADQPDKLILSQPWQGGPIAAPDGGWIWVVPQAPGNNRSPCVAIYQKVMKF